MTNNPDSLDKVTVHASAVYTDAGALIFLGPSETGKSTICRLLQAYARPLADDSVHLLRHNGSWGVANADNRGFEGSLEQQAITQQWVPLRAILRLYQASKPQLEPIDALLTCRYLTDALFEVQIRRLLDTEGRRQAFAHLATIARSVPGYHLYFDRSLQTPTVVGETFELKPMKTRRNDASQN